MFVGEVPTGGRGGGMEVLGVLGDLVGKVGKMVVLGYPRRPWDLENWTGIVRGKVWRGQDPQGGFFASLAHACSWSLLEPINDRLMQWCATLLAPWSFVLCTSPFAGFPVDGPLGWTVDRDLMELHLMPPPATAAPSQSHSVTHTHTRGHKRASRRMLESRSTH